MKRWQVLADGALGGRACGCHSRLRGNGLSKPLDSSLRWNDGGGKNGDKPPRCNSRSRLFTISAFPFPKSISSFRRRPESTPAWMQVVEPRLEQAAEESRAGMLGRFRLFLTATPDRYVWWSFPLKREWLV